MPLSHDVGLNNAEIAHLNELTESVPRVFVRTEKGLRLSINQWLLVGGQGTKHDNMTA
jgi:hypothetical protein